MMTHKQSYAECRRLLVKHFPLIKPQPEIDREELDHARAALFTVLALDTLIAAALIGLVVCGMV